MNSFTEGQRVKVKKAEDGNIINRIGVVTRCRIGDNGAWIQLDRGKVLPNGEKVRKVLAYPEDCQPAKDTTRARREAKVENARIVPTIEQFGKDHWSTFGYIECRIVDNDGVPNRFHMRCHPGRHPLLAHEGSHMGAPSPTRLKGDARIENHDDWDCVDDLIQEGLLENHGTGMNPKYVLTDKGNVVAAQLRRFKAKGGNFGDFVPDLSAEAKP